MFILFGRGMELGSEMPRLPACLLALALIVTCSPKNSRAEAKPGNRPRRAATSRTKTHRHAQPDRRPLMNPEQQRAILAIARHAGQVMTGGARGLSRGHASARAAGQGCARSGHGPDLKHEQTTRPARGSRTLAIVLLTLAFERRLP